MKLLKEAVELINEAQNIIVISGAGISTSAGIPDYRSPGSGLYDNLAKYGLPYPEAIFDINYFPQNPKPFFQLAAKLMPSEYEPTKGHNFIKSIEDRNKLTRLYTQNIDGLDHKAGTQNIIECHGSFYSSTCMDCGKYYLTENIKNIILKGDIPFCSCQAKGIIKPDVVFYGEQLPAAFYANIEKDFSEADLLIIIGSSMTVHPVASLPNYLSPTAKTILINRESIGLSCDLELLGNIDDICQKIGEAE